MGKFKDISLGDWLKIVGIAGAIMLAAIAWYVRVETVRADIIDVQAFQEREVATIHPRFVTREKLEDSLKPIQVQMRAIEKKQDVMQQDVRELLRRIPPR